MPRTKGGVVTRRRHKRILKAAKGFFSSRRRHYRTARETLFRALHFAYRHRRQRKRDFRALWIQRINAGCRQNGSSYSQLIHGLNQANIRLDRKMLAAIALDEPETFAHLVTVAREAAQT